MAATSENIVYLVPRDRQPEASPVDPRILDIQRSIVALMNDDSISGDAFIELSRIQADLGIVKLSK